LPKFAVIFAAEVSGQEFWCSTEPHCKYFHFNLKTQLSAYTLWRDGGVAVQLHPFLTFALDGVSGQSNVVNKRINRLTDLAD